MKKEYILELTVKHLEWLNYDYGWNQMSYRELCGYVYKVYTEQLEPLRLEYRNGRTNKRVHELLTKGYKYTREVCRDHDVEWPPQPVDNIQGHLAEIESKCTEIERDLYRTARQLETLKSEIKLLKIWNRQSK